MKLDMIGIATKEIEKAIAFYRLLGFEPIGEVTKEYVELNNQGVRLSLNSKKMLTSIHGTEPKIIGETIELAFLCESSLEVDERVAQLRQSGYPIVKEPWDAFWGQRYAIVKDADGHNISLFASL